MSRVRKFKRRGLTPEGDAFRACAIFVVGFAILFGLLAYSIGPPPKVVITKAQGGIQP